MAENKSVVPELAVFVIRPGVSPGVAKFRPIHVARAALFRDDALEGFEVACAVQARVEDDARLHFANLRRRDAFVAVRNGRLAVKPEQVNFSVTRQQFLDLPANHRGVFFLKRLELFGVGLSRRARIQVGINGRKIRMRRSGVELHEIFVVLFKMPVRR